MKTFLQRSTLLLVAAFFAASSFAQGNSNANNNGNQGNANNNGQAGNSNKGQGQNAKCVLTPPSNISVFAEKGQCGSNVTFADAATSGNCGTVTYEPASGSFFNCGTTTVKATSSTGATATFTVTVVDAEDPTIAIPNDISVGTDPGLCQATLSITAPTASDGCSLAAVTGVRSDGIKLNAPYPKGLTTITWTATDKSGNKTSCTQKVLVIDTEAPVISETISATPNVLWSPNHEMADIELTYDVTDNCPDVTYEVTSITSNEEVNGQGDGNTEEDWEVVDGKHVKLRAERAGNGTGRIYTITVRGKDAAGNYSELRSVTVTVPHNQGGTVKATNTALNVTVAPNPSSTSFTSKVETKNSADRITMVVSDATGRVVFTKTNIISGQTVNWGSELKPGLYFINLQQGSATTQSSVMKTK